LETGPGTGAEVHAASFLRARVVVLDTALADAPGELARVVAHELFHFVWLRLGNGKRRAWGELLLGDRGAGEMGWSAEWRRRGLRPEDGRLGTRRWREYASESFCDTGAWVATGERGDQDRELGGRWVRRRERFFEELKSHWKGVWRI
jgi:hypothetical protein